MPNSSRLLILAAFALAACSDNASKPKSGRDAGTHYLPDGGQQFPDGGVELPDGGGLLPDGGVPGLCASHTDCAAGQVCIAGSCSTAGSVGVGGRCYASLDCGTGLYCSPYGFCAHAGSGASDAGCTTDGDCASGLRCVYSGFAAHCGASTGNGDLGDACTAQTDCMAGLFCSNGLGGAARTCQAYGAAFPPYTGPTCTDDTPLRVYFSVPRPSGYPSDFFKLPYPNDIRVTTDSDGGKHLDISDFPTPGVSLADVDLVQLYKDALTADFDGFSTVAPVTFRFSGGINFSTIGNFVKIVDLTEPVSSSVFFYEFTYVTNGNKYNCPNRLTVGPTEATPLKAGHTYAVLLMSGITDENGNGVVADADLVSILGASAPPDTTLANAYAAYAPLRAWIADPNNAISSNQIVGASVFTVGKPLAAMTGVAAAVAAEAAPTISDLEVCGTGGASTCDDLGPDHVCSAASPDFYEIHGRISMPIYQAGQEPYLTPDAGGGISFDANGNAVKVRTENVCFALTVPKSTAPGAGWPLVITHHGTGGSMTDFIRSGVSDKLATAATPMAVLGFDAVEHADRRGGSTQDPDNLVFNALNPRAARDNFIQGAADILTEAKFAGLVVNAAADGGGPGNVSFDATHVEFFGHSQGSTSGELALPFLDAAPNAVLSGASAHLTQSLLHKTSPINIKVGLAALLQEDPGQLDTEHPVLGLYQNFFDRSDPINSVGAIVNAPLTGHNPHSVFLTWGTHDTYTPEQVLNANVVAMNVPIAHAAGTPDGGEILEGGGYNQVDRPVAGNITVGSSTVTAAFSQYATPDGGDGHFVAFEVPGAEIDWTNFLQSGLAGTPQLQ
ncbi:MAG: hypothetical protein JST54_04055 [Deltaproteobacteria bacterium]|nr:hypothetical protein [Deltaproteobacteria bacterium]